ncbi:LuxR C-terminal-related transcriptional regulator [Streptomyces smaragdinus]|uniref:LuxR C-terminal-related transcriptional regulator n=1 Tax=Streptomyces smaragdinus TaxID=2585196 RepID=UPI001886731C|nr:helix-turn-helix transcriptional regulator [Streptomyces smaragdinus]
MVCEFGREIYTQALTRGGVRAEVAHVAPCLLESGLLKSDTDESGLFRPLPPSAGLDLLMNRHERAYLRQAAELVADFQGMVERTDRTPTGLSVFTVSGLDRINERLDALMLEATDEVLVMQPGSRPREDANTLGRTLSMLERGVAMRTLYVHAARYANEVLAHQRRLARHNVQIRTVDEVFDTMLVVDAEVAVLTADNDFTVLEIRHAPVVSFLRRTFDVLWEHGKSLGTPLERVGSMDGVSPVQIQIARLMVAGNDDQEIAARLGISIRTVRGHIAKLSAALGSNGRTQLGYLLAGSGLMDEGDKAGD